MTYLRPRRVPAVVAAAALGLAALLGAPAAQAATPATFAEALAQLRQCESTGRYGISTGNGYYGAYQFDLSTWRSVGGSGYPHQASPAVQDEMATRLYERRAWQPWPACSRKLRLPDFPDPRAAPAPPPPAVEQARLAPPPPPPPPFDGTPRRVGHA